MRGCAASVAARRRRRRCRMGHLKLYQILLPDGGFVVHFDVFVGGEERRVCGMTGLGDNEAVKSVAGPGFTAGRPGNVGEGDGAVGEADGGIEAGHYRVGLGDDTADFVEVLEFQIDHRGYKRS